MMAEAVMKHRDEAQKRRVDMLQSKQHSMAQQQVEGAELNRIIKKRQPLHDKAKMVRAKITRVEDLFKLGA